jgi:hypothetical protein
MLPLINNSSIRKNENILDKQAKIIIRRFPDIIPAFFKFFDARSLDSFPIVSHRFNQLAKCYDLLQKGNLTHFNLFRHLLGKPHVLSYHEKEKCQKHFSSKNSDYCGRIGNTVFKLPDIFEKNLFSVLPGFRPKKDSVILIDATTGSEKIRVRVTSGTVRTCYPLTEHSFVAISSDGSIGHCDVSQTPHVWKEKIRIFSKRAFNSIAKSWRVKNSIFFEAHIDGKNLVYHFNLLNPIAPIVLSSPTSKDLVIKTTSERIFVLKAENNKVYAFSVSEDDEIKFIWRKSWPKEPLEFLKMAANDQWVGRILHGSSSATLQIMDAKNGATVLKHKKLRKDLSELAFVHNRVCAAAGTVLYIWDIPTQTLFPIVDLARVIRQPLFLETDQIMIRSSGILLKITSLFSSGEAPIIALASKALKTISKEVDSH